MDIDEPCLESCAFTCLSRPYAVLYRAGIGVVVGTNIGQVKIPRIGAFGVGGEQCTVKKNIEGSDILIVDFAPVPPTKWVTLVEK